MFCSECGNKLLENDKFCSKCGKKVFRNDQENQLVINNDNISIEDKQSKSLYKSILIKCVLVAIGICVFLQILFILTNETTWDLSFRVWQSVQWIIIYSVGASIAIDLYEKTILKSMAVASLILIVIGFALSTLATWEVFEYSEFFWRLMATLWITSFAFAHSSRLFLIRFKSTIATNALFATIAVLTIMYIIAIYMVNFEPNSDFLTRIFMVLIILTLFGTVATMLLNKVYKTDDFDNQIATK